MANRTGKKLGSLVSCLLLASCSYGEETSEKCTVGYSRLCRFVEEKASLTIGFKPITLDWGKSQENCLSQDYPDKDFSNISKTTCGISGQELVPVISNDNASVICTSGDTSITYRHDTNSAVYKTSEKELELACEESGSNSPSN